MRSPLTALIENAPIAVLLALPVVRKYRNFPEGSLTGFAGAATPDRHHDPYHCYIVHQRKDGSCPPGYISGIPFSNYFIEPDGTREYACLDLHSPAAIDKNNPNRRGSRERPLCGLS